MNLSDKREMGKVYSGATLPPILKAFCILEKLGLL